MKKRRKAATKLTKKAADQEETKEKYGSVTVVDAVTQTDTAEPMEIEREHEEAVNHIFSLDECSDGAESSEDERNKGPC